MCNEKGVIWSDEPTENYHMTAAPLSSTEVHNVFQLILLFHVVHSFSVVVPCLDKLTVPSTKGS